MCKTFNLQNVALTVKINQNHEIEYTLFDESRKLYFHVTSNPNRHEWKFHEACNRVKLYYIILNDSSKSQ